MMIKRVSQIVAFIFMCITGFPATAQNILTVRSASGFEQSMTGLKASIEAHGYTVSHVQRCDGGLHDFGYETDYYRVIFFGKLDEIRKLSAKRPDLIPFLPLKIAVFAEGNQTIISSINLVSLNEFYRDDELRVQFKRWENDLQSIMADLQKSE